MKKRRGRTRLVLSIVFIVLVTAAYVLGWSSLFTVKQVVVVGSPNPSETYVIAHSIPTGGKMARLESQGIAKSLKSYSWLDHAQVSRNWLKGIVTVKVWTRTPIAQFQNHLVDSDGVVFDLPSVDATHLPMITGPKVESAKFAVEILTGLPPSIRLHVQSVLVHGTESANLVITDSTLKRALTVAWGDETNMALKVKVYQALLALPENSKIHEIDLSAPHAPIVK